MKKWINHFLKGWDHYWFDVHPLHALALFRFLSGVLIFLYYLNRLPHTEELFSSDALHILSPLFQKLPWESMVFSTPIASMIVVAALIVTASFAIGFFTRTSNFFMILFMLYLDGIDYSVTPGYYGILLISSSLLLFSPAGRFGSMDYLIWKKGKKPRQIKQRAYGLIWAPKLIVYQIAIVYFSCALHKSMYGAGWYSGRMLKHYFISDNVGMLPLGLFLAHQEWLMPILGTLTVVLQLFLGILFLTPQYRYIGIFLGFFFHFMTLFTFKIPYAFCFTMWVHYLLVAKPEHIQLLVEKLFSFLVSLNLRSRPAAVKEES